MRLLEYSIKVYHLYTSAEECYEIFAMDVADAFETLLEQEPSIKMLDIICAVEHSCASLKDSIH